MRSQLVGTTVQCWELSSVLCGDLDGWDVEAQRVKLLPAVRETRVRSLGSEDSLEKEMATHSGTVAWKIPWMEKPGRLWYMGSQRVRHD